MKEIAALPFMFENEARFDLIMNQKTVLLSYLIVNVQGGFFNWSALKMTKCQILRKF